MGKCRISLVLHSVGHIRRVVGSARRKVIATGCRAKRPRNCVDTVCQKRLTVDGVLCTGGRDLYRLGGRTRACPGTLRGDLIGFFVFRTKFSLVFMGTGSKASSGCCVTNRIFHVISYLGRILFTYGGTCYVGRGGTVGLLRAFRRGPRGCARGMGRVFRMLNVSLFRYCSVARGLCGRIGRVMSRVGGFLGRRDSSREGRV